MHLRLLVAVILLSVSITARSDDAHHTLWVVKGTHNIVYLFGSLHALKAGDRDLPSEALRALANSKALVMEIKLDEVSSDKLPGSVLGLATLPPGQTLAGALGPDVYSKFVAHAELLGLHPEVMSRLQPWFAATMVDQLELARLGFDSDAGVDQLLAKRAQSAHKEIIALESIEDQLGIFAHLSLDEQRRYMLYSLAEVDNIGGALDAIVSAWHNGDTKGLEQLLGQASKQFPDLYNKLTIERNRKWLPTITGLLNDDQDYLVVVGALHLVGNGSIVDLLQKQGYEVVQH